MNAELRKEKCYFPEKKKVIFCEILFFYPPNYTDNIILFITSTVRMSSSSQEIYHVGIEHVHVWNMSVVSFVNLFIVKVTQIAWNPE